MQPTYDPWGVRAHMLTSALPYSTLSFTTVVNILSSLLVQTTHDEKQANRGSILTHQAMRLIPQATIPFQPDPAGGGAARLRENTQNELRVVEKELQALHQVNSRNLGMIPGGVSSTL